MGCRITRKLRSAARMTDVVLYRCHFQDVVTDREVARLRAELPHFDHVTIGYHNEKEVMSQARVVLSPANLSSLAYGGDKLLPSSYEGGGADDLPVLWFYRQNPTYDHYWCIEYDVRYSGHWLTLFSDLMRSQADLLATNIVNRSDKPLWEWWRTLKSDTDIALELHTKAFQPFCRISNRALREINKAYSDGTSGHYEVTWPTICRVNHFLVEDIGGNGSYTPPNRRHKHYASNTEHWSLYPGTFVFRPSFLDRDFSAIAPNLTHEPMLWHPVKW